MRSTSETKKKKHSHVVIKCELDKKLIKNSARTDEGRLYVLFCLCGRRHICQKILNIIATRDLKVIIYVLRLTVVGWNLKQNFFRWFLYYMFVCDFFLFPVEINKRVDG